MPAEELEHKMVELVRSMLSAPTFAASIVPDATTDTIGRLAATLSAIACDGDRQTLCGLVGRVDIASGKLQLQLVPSSLAERLGVGSAGIDDNALTSSHPFQPRKRGVETKLILGDAPPEKDETLIRNIARAYVLFERIKAEQTFTEIAAMEDTSKRRIQQMIGLAFLAADIVRDVLDGRQPLGFTSDWCLRHDLPSDWVEQRAIIAVL